MTGATRPTGGWNFDNSYLRLPEAFFVRLHPIPVRTPTLVVFNESLARGFGFGFTTTDENDLDNLLVSILQQMPAMLVD